MANRFLVENLTESVQSNMGVPDNDLFLQPEEYAAFLNSEMEIKLIPYILEQRAEYFSHHVDVTVTPGVSAYDIPSNAIGDRIKGIHQVDTNGKTTIKVPGFSSDVTGNGLLQPSLYGFYIEGSQWVLFPEPTNGLTFRIFYYKRPNRIVAQTEGGLITVVASNVLTLRDNPPSAWDVGTMLDVVRATPPFNTISTVEIVSINGRDVTVDDATDIIVNDTVAAEGEAIVAQLPAELRPLLIQSATVMAFKAKKDFEAAREAKTEYTEMVDNIFPLITPRVENSPRRITGVGNIASYVVAGRTRP